MTMSELLMAGGVASLVSAFWVELKAPHVVAEALLIGLGMVVYFSGWAVLNTLGG